MAALFLDEREPEQLEITFGGETFLIPLAFDIPYEQMRNLDESMDSAIEFFRQYIPQDVVERLTPRHYKAIFEAWSEASKANGGMPVGES